jgi:hypothetical protein
LKDSRRTVLRRTGREQDKSARTARGEQEDSKRAAKGQQETEGQQGDCTQYKYSKRTACKRAACRRASRDCNTSRTIRG